MAADAGAAGKEAGYHGNAAERSLGRSDEAQRLILKLGLIFIITARWGISSFYMHLII